MRIQTAASDHGAEVNVRDSSDPQLLRAIHLLRDGNGDRFGYRKKGVEMTDRKDNRHKDSQEMVKLPYRPDLRSERRDDLWDAYITHETE